MPADQRQPRRSVPTRIWLLAVVVAVPVLWLLIGPLGGEQREPGGTGPDSPPSGLPLEVRESVHLTVPEAVRTAAGTFTASAGSSYLVSADVSTEKPAGSDGTAMFLAVGVQCSTPAADDGNSIGGTQNLLDGEPTSLRNQFVLTADVDGVYTCSVTASNPYDHVAAEGVAVEIDATLSVDRAPGFAVMADAGEYLPRTVAPGSRRTVLEQEVRLGDLHSVSERELRVLSSLHVTTCTGVNGSRELGRTWCETGDIDEAGSSFADGIRVEVVDSYGSVCSVLREDLRRIEIDRHRHHQLLAADETIELPDHTCGETVRVTRTVEEDGPASLVVHASNSSLVVLETVQR